MSGITNVCGGGSSDEEDGGGFGVGDKLGVGGEDGACGEGKREGTVQLVATETRQAIIKSTVSLPHNV